MKGLDGIQGPTYIRTGCVFRRQALYGFDSPRKKKEASNQDMQLLARVVLLWMLLYGKEEEEEVEDTQVRDNGD